MVIGVPKETYPGERRVALVPASVAPLTKSGLEVVLETGAGANAGYPDSAYADKGAKIASSRAEVFEADIVAQVRCYGANLEAGRADLQLMRSGQVVIGFFEPLTSVAAAREVAAKGVTLFAMEMIPRITRAQSMDALSSMATVAGYKAVLLAAGHLPKMFPMMMTAAGTVSPAKVFVVGAGVAGLQAIATSRRLGAVVEAYDVRPAVKEQIESLGAKFIEMELEAGQSEDQGGYAKQMGEEFYRKQREMMTKIVANSDVVITTAAVPGKKAPTLITAEMVAGMTPGAVIVDLAAERGGNVELTKPGETVVENGVTIVGPLNIPTTLPFHASQMYSKNVTTLVKHLVKDGELELNMDDEITSGTMVSRDGAIVQPAMRQTTPAAASEE
jgi:NAD(P) transhydrogenase subunit alpha